MKVYGVVLAGGASQRMQGLNKAGLLLDGKSLLEICAEAIRSSVDEVLISASEETLPLASAITDQVIVDESPLQGPLAAVAYCLNWIAQYKEEALVVFIPCDVPVFPSTLVKKLVDAADAKQPSYAIYNDDNLYTFAAWPIHCASSLSQFLERGNRSLSSALHFFNATSLVIFQSNDPRSFLNINTREDWEQFLALTRVQRESK